MRLVIPLLLVSRLAVADAVLIVPDDIASTVEAAVAKLPGKPQVGATTTIAVLGKIDDVAKAASRARDRLVAKGYVVLRDTVQKTGELVILDAKGGARVAIALDAGRGSIAITARPSSTKAPGACVAIPSVTHDVYVTGRGIDDGGELHEGTTHWLMTTSAMFDLDGDGIPDAMVPQPTDKHECPEEMMWKVYVMRGTCGHELGVIGPGSPDEGDVPIDASGFRPITMTRQTSGGKTSIPELTTTTTTFAVTKGRYVQTHQEQHSGLCHHCARWHCHGA